MIEMMLGAVAVEPVATKRFALVDRSGLVVNVIVVPVSGTYTTPPGLRLVPADGQCGPGWRFDGDAFTEPTAKPL